MRIITPAADASRRLGRGRERHSFARCRFMHDAAMKSVMEMTIPMCLPRRRL